MKKQITIFIIGMTFLFISIFIGVTLGAKEIKIIELTESIVIRDIRLPRVLGAMLVGSALSVTGAIMQGLTKNPLADPGILGISAGSNLALVIAIIFFPTMGYLGINLFSFFGAVLSTMLILGVTRVKSRMSSSSNIILAGLAVSTLLFAISTGMGLYFNVSKNINIWTSSGLVGTSWIQVKIMIFFVLIGFITAIIYSKDLTILSLNEELAIGLGQDSKKTKGILFIITIILGGSSTALAGNMMFMGIIVPHMVRRVVGSDYRHIIPASILGGASFMVISDTLARTMKSPYELPVVAITTIIGLPFFLFIVNRGIKSFK